MSERLSYEITLFKRADHIVVVTVEAENEEEATEKAEKAAELLSGCETKGFDVFNAEQGKAPEGLPSGIRYVTDSWSEDEDADWSCEDVVCEDAEAPEEAGEA